MLRSRSLFQEFITKISAFKISIINFKAAEFHTTLNWQIVDVTPSLLLQDATDDALSKAMSQRILSQKRINYFKSYVILQLWKEW